MVGIYVRDLVMVWVFVIVRTLFSLCWDMMVDNIFLVNVTTNLSTVEKHARYSNR